MSPARGSSAEVMATVSRFHSELRKDANHRFRSWGYCFDYFRRLRSGEKGTDRDGACLHLGFYLASWGMYRGSSFLLGKDYRIHRGAVDELLKPEYAALWRTAVPARRAERGRAKLIQRLRRAIYDAYSKQITRVTSDEEECGPTDTLTTKILLGTVGCTPAYDQFVIAAVREAEIAYTEPSERHLISLWEFCRKRSNAFAKLQASLSENGLRYPPMKLVDMYFWIRGRDLSE